ncbi:Cytochrome c oxidase subunit 8B, mitochondrial [Heterocephalus glaber]|uniref:Cytochrome c oxidase subunit 8 n=1 Tax=Heterocephalus glaber TaxID=10181 RepID=G5AUB8_HETGA|nr:cytochrome c oxidase subunit 8B, mitochondrial [Heterocephalus glaber]EHB00629.1 Cytochrome c oxidase subunit 8B, mitochondrial [Heterocephalus glaber]
MLRLASTTQLLQAPLRCWVLPKAHVSAKPARTPTSPMEQAVGISAIFISFLVPASWVLTHLEGYKKSSVA